MSRIICIFSSLFLIFSLEFLHAQPPPCTDGSQSTCTCYFSPLLCSIEELDGYYYKMDKFLHPDDGPDNPMCWNQGGTTAHNPTWFRFLAVCEDISLTVNTTNCLNGGLFGCNSRGVQVAVYPECNWQNPWDAVACDVNHCRNNAPWSQTINLSMTGLVVGKVYSLIVDGCCNSACDVTITVTSPYCPPEIGAWPGEIIGPEYICVGDYVEYCIEEPLGGLKFRWTLNGTVFAESQFDEDGSGISCFSEVFSTPGEYLLCVDTENQCVPYSSNPVEKCKTITVVSVDAGTITANPTPTCPDKNVNIQVSGYATAQGLSQYIVIVDASGTVVQVTEGSSDIFTWPECGVFTAYSYNFVTAQQPIPQVGDNFASIQAGCAGAFQCCDFDSVDIIFEDDEAPLIMGVPDDITISCYEDLPNMPDLNYTDNCLGPGTVAGEKEDNYTDCAGGTITRTWTVEDGCGNITTETQVITVDPIPEATFTAMDDMTVTCEMFPPASLMPPLNYDNGKTGGCQIMGSIIPTRTVDTLQCMGTVSYHWLVKDKCERDIEETQVYTVEPPTEADFINPPSDVTVTCNDFPVASYLPPLSYTNGSTGMCLISGQIIPIQVVDTSNCEGTVTFIWDGLDRCGRNLHHEQVWTIEPPQEIMFVNPPIDEVTLSCADIPDPGILPPLSYNNGEPAGRCRIEGSVIPVRIDNYDICGGTIEMLWEKTDSCGRYISHSQLINVEPAPEPQWINPPADVDLPCGQSVADDFMPDLAYSNGIPNGDFCAINGMVAPVRENDIQGCSGTVTFTWEFTDPCGRQISHVQVYTLNPPDEPQWINPPADITVQSCDGYDFDDLPFLSYDNGQTGPDCGIMGSVQATRTGSVDDCVGSYEYTWEFMDDCDRTITHTRVITVEPPQEAAFVNPPADQTVACEMKPGDDPVDLMYTNGGSGTCLISGTISATPDIQENDDCSKIYTYEWEFTDDCNRTISHTQTINVDPPTEPQWINPPADITVASCDGFDFDELTDLGYDNGGQGDCEISGMVTPVRTGDVTDCQGAYVYTWTFMDNCGRSIEHIRTVTVVPPPIPQFVNPPADITVASCDGFDFDELTDLGYDNGGQGDCEISGMVTPVRTGDVTDCQGAYVYTWTFMDNCGRSIEHIRTVTVVPPPIPQFVNPPTNETANCDAVPDPDTPVDLEYTNNGTGSCLIAGTVSALPQVQENDDCSKIFTYEWEYIDNCGRTITHSKTVNVLPPPQPVFLNGPADITVSCNAAPDLTLPQILNYSNNVSGFCEISGSVEAQVQSTIVNCIGTHQLVWDFTDNCGRTIQWRQTITVNPPAEPSFVNAPPAISSVSCDDEPDPSNLPILHFTNSDTGDCLIEGDAIPDLRVTQNGCSKVYTYDWNYTDMCNRTITYTQIINVSPPPPAVFINPPVYTTMSCEDAELFDAPELEFSNNASCEISGTARPIVNKQFTACGGTIDITWTETDWCDRNITYNQIISVLPAPPPSFTSDLPDDITVSCQELTGYQIPLSYSNELGRPCGREGAIVPVLDNSKVTLCGGIATLTWQQTDLCGFTLQHVQNITVLPAPPAEFLNLPDPTVTVSCTDVPAAPPALNYSNGESGMCAIIGSVTPIQTGGYTACGGTIEYTWQFTDQCGRSIVYNQSVIILPADEPYFTSEPDDEFLPCNQGFPGLVPLTYTNGLTGPCAINGSVTPTYEDSGDTRTFTWTYTNNCTGNTITTTQEVTISPVPDIVADPVSVDICVNDYYDLADVQVTDLAGTNIVLTYHYGTPANFGNQLPSTWVTIEGTYYILATNEYGCTDEVAIRINNVVPPNSGYGKSISICSEDSSVNLWDLLDPPYDNYGYWSDEYGYGIDVSDPTNVSFEGKAGGVYELFYIVPSGNLCPDPMTSVTIEVVEPGFFEIVDVICASDFDTYTVKLNVFDFNVTTSIGTISKNGSVITISGIPIASSVTLTFTSIGLCGDETVTIDPPQCDCPIIANPISGGNKKACQNQTGVTLSVTVESGLTAQWYSAQSGGTLLQDNSLTYEPPTSVVGVTTYYVLAIDPQTGCKSQRIAIQFEVVANPTVNSAVLKVCDDDTDGIAQFNLDDAKTKVVSGGGFTFSYHQSLSDAQNEINPLPANYTNTSNNQVIYVVVKNANGCKSIAEVTLTVLPLPSNTLTITNEICSGKNDGSILVNPPTTGLEFKLNNLPWTSDPLISNLADGSYTLQIRDGNQCVVSIPVTINEGQKLSFETFTITCNNQGTLSVGDDDTYDIVMNVVSLPSAPGNTYTVIYNGQTLGTSFAYATNNTMSIPADGSTGTIEVIDNTTGCKVTRNVGPLTPCSTSCAIELSSVNIQCDNKDTDSDPTDDTYTIVFIATAVNNGSSTTFQLLINNVIQGTYNYGDLVTITLAADGSTPDIRIRDSQNIQCFTSLDAGTLNSCSGTCQIAATVSKITCNNNGTINDPADDTFTFTIRVTGNNVSASWKIAGQGDTHPYNTDVILGPYPISGGNLSLIIVDTDDGSCTQTVNVTAPEPCSTPCVLEVVDVTIFDCDNNNTGNTSADDFFKVTFKVNALSGSVNFYNVTFNGKTYGSFTYGQEISINDLPANGTNLVLTIQDAVNDGCITTVTVSQAPCSFCPQTVDAGPDIILTCTNNTATLTATASESGGVFVWTGPNGFNKTGQTVTTSAEGEYTVTVTFPDQCQATDVVLVSKDANLPAANAGPDQELTCIKKEAILAGSSNLPDNVIYTWTNAAGMVIGNTPTITVTEIGFYYLEVTNTLNNCKSGKDEVEVFNKNQQLHLVTNKWICSNNGTPTTGDDDIYTYTFSLSNTTSATNTYKMLRDGVVVGTYNYNQEYSVTIPADGNNVVYVFVDDVTGCELTATVGPLEPCSTDCELEISDLSIVCFDNDTESIDTDDYFVISFTVTGVNTGASNKFNVSSNGKSLGDYTYGTKVTFNFDADGSDPFIVIKDLNINGCQIVLPAPKLNPCSSKCDIEATVSNILCNDNGTINDLNDDIFYFDIVVNGLNTSSGWKAQGMATFAYGEVVTMGPYPISGGNVTLTIEDSGTATCTDVVTITPPAVCSEPCVIEVVNLNILDCNNNQTGTTDADDFFAVTFSVNRISGSAKNYTVTAGNKEYGPFVYGNVIRIDSLPANGQNIKLIIIDPSNSGCQTEVNVSKNPCSSCTQTADAGANQEITCQSNIVTLTGTATAGGTFEWTGPNGFIKTGESVTTSTAGTYYLRVTYPDQCVAIDSVIVTKDASVPDAFAGVDQTLTCILGEVVLTGSTATQSTTLQFIWKNDQGVIVSNQPTLLVNNPGTYYFEVINTENGCSSGADEVTVRQDIEQPEAVINADPGNLIDCVVGTILLSGKPVANVIFNWNTGETIIANQPSILVSSPGTITMTAIDTINGCENTAMIEIIDLQDYPILITKPTEPITCVNNGVYISAGLSPDGPDLVFAWYDKDNKLIAGATGDSLFVTSPGTYYVVLTDTLNGCSNRDTLTVERIGDFPVVKLSDDVQLFCGETTTSLSADILNPASSTTLKWSSNDGTIISPVTQSKIEVSGSGVYTVEVTYNDSGCKTTENVTVEVDNDYPVDMRAIIDDESCKNEKDGSITIDFVTGGKEPILYALNNGTPTTNNTFSPIAPGQYTLRVVDANGCTLDTVIIVHAGYDVQLFANSPIELIYKETRVIELITNLEPHEIASIKWTPSDNLSCDDCLVTTMTGLEDVTYIVEITDINGCKQSVRISVRINDNAVITVPNIIDPKSGGNQFFSIFANESVISVDKMAVYDRWGNLMFIKENIEPNIPNEGWNGTFLGRPVEQGVYVYIIQYTTPSGPKTLTGDVTVMR
ncbi:MAG: gliding motility-associated C-terminal domain-containing protein [Chitinophagales bacterium]|nr:gliding motility-associated C-terminal domain-containing protein [Chitinophagales bacterium]